LLTRIEDEREQKSIESLERLADYGIEYVQYINEPCKEYPLDLEPLQVHKEKKPGYYGAYEAFRQGIENEFSEDVDLLIVCECDCVLGVEPDEFVDLLYKVSQVDFDYFSFGQNDWSGRIKDLTKECYSTDKIILAHCVMFGKQCRDFLLARYKKLKWDSPDLWLDYAFNGKKKVVLNTPVAFQHEGFSLIDNEEKSGEYRIKDDYSSIKGNFDSEPLYRYIVNTLDKGHIVELGAWFGKSTAFLAQLIKDSGKDIQLDVVDTWEGSGEDEQERVLQKCGGSTYPIFEKHMKRLGLFDYIDQKIMTSMEACGFCSDNSLDLVFIDADHDYESVLEDIEGWFHKVKKGGILAGHDFLDYFPGVEKAVREFFGDNYAVKHTTWYHIKGEDVQDAGLLEETYSEVDDVKCEFSFIGGPKVNISGSSSLAYDVEFIDQDSNSVVYTDNIKPQHWAGANRKYFTNWLINVRYEGKKIASHALDLEGKRVLLGFGSKSLGDTIAWFPYVEEFRKKHSCEVHVSGFWNSLFREEYPELHFIEPGESVDGVYAVYEIGCFDDGLGVSHKEDWRVIPMQKIATDILGLEYEEIRPKITVPDLPRTQKKDYVSISEFSTMQCKFWNHAGGWDLLVDEIKLMGLQVMSVSKEKTRLKKARRCNNKPIEETIRNIYHSKAFIGVGSGLSWLAWALGVPTVVVSGFSAAFCEFKDSDSVSRIINEDKCNGCFNDVEYYFDRGDWNWCPRDEDYECSKSITTEQVLKGLKKVLK
jgi:autotransporter strand-loop-strand O-heptosyltransferase